jgi:hypothetical protein
MGATAAIGMVAGGSLFGAYTKLKAGREQQKMFEENAQFADWQASDALDRGATNEKRQRQSTEQVIGAQRTSLAAQRVDVNKGSALDVQADAAYLGELDALTVRNNAAKEAYGFAVQAKDLRTRGKYAKQGGEMDALNTIIGGGSSLLLAKYGGGPYTISNAGAFRPVSSGVAGTGAR